MVGIFLDVNGLQSNSEQRVVAAPGKDYLGADGRVYLDINGASYHGSQMGVRGHKFVHDDDRHLSVVRTEEKKRYNESNPGIGLRYEWGEPNELKKFISAGGYKNSLNRDTYYISGGLKKRLIGDDALYMDVGAMAGAMTGYDNGLRAALLPMVSVGGGRYGVNLMYAPAYDESPETYMLNMSYKLK